MNFSPSSSSGRSSESTSRPVQEPSSQLVWTTSSFTTSTTGNIRKRKICKVTEVLDPGDLPNTVGDPPPVPPPVQCQKKRGIFKRWASDVEVAALASSHIDTIQLISTLAATSVNILNKNPNTPSYRLINHSICSSTSVLRSEGNSLGAIASRLRKREEKGDGVNFDIAISLIQFALKLDILQEERNQDFTTLIREEIQSLGGELAGYTERQGKRWRAWGTRLVEFVGAGKSFLNMNK